LIHDSQQSFPPIFLRIIPGIFLPISCNPPNFLENY